MTADASPKDPAPKAAVAARDEAPRSTLAAASQFFRSALFDIWFYALMFVMGVLCAPLALFSRDGAYWSCRSFARIAIWSLKRLCGVHVEIRGTPPTDHALIAAKHQSFLDILIMVSVLPRATFVMKRSLIYAPILGFYALRLGVAPVDRGAGSKAVRAMRKTLQELSDDPESEPRQIVIYPQGTRLPPGAVAPYRPGVALLYSGSPNGCTPVATNTGLFWGRRSILKRPGVAVISFLPAIEAGMKRAEFMELLEQRIESASDALMEEVVHEAQ